VHWHARQSRQSRHARQSRPQFQRLNASFLEAQNRPTAKLKGDFFMERAQKIRPCPLRHFDTLHYLLLALIFVFGGAKPYSLKAEIIAFKANLPDKRKTKTA
jgi:hypothetical protein